jgi:hypothetical protein
LVDIHYQGQVDEIHSVLISCGYSLISSIIIIITTSAAAIFPWSSGNLNSQLAFVSLQPSLGYKTAYQARQVFST